MPYIPKLHHAFIAAVFCAVCIGLAGVTRGSVSTAFKVLALISGFGSVIVLVLLLMEGINGMVRAQTDWMEEFGKLDDEGRAAVAFVFPQVRYRMKRGEVRGMFEDTNVPIEMFRLFLQTSNDRYISPERDWSSADMPRWVWLEIFEWLDAQDYIVRESAAGSHSWLWKGNAYQHLMAYWMAGRRVENISREWSQA